MRALKHRLLACLLLLFVSLASRPAMAVVPGAPTLTAASYSTTQINLSWTIPSGSPTSYNIYRSMTAGGEGATPYLPGFTGAFKADTGLPSGQAYYYQVSAVNASGEGPRSTEATAITGIPLSLIRGGHATVTLTWSAGGNAAGYNVYRAEAAVGVFTKLNASLITATTYQDTAGLSNGKTYSYQLTAVGASAQESGRSPAFQVTPNVRINCGGSALNTDVNGLVWSAETGSSGGVANSTPNQQNPSADQTLYQNQEQEATAGGGLTYTLPVENGVYTLILGFSEINGYTNGPGNIRKFNVKANGQQVLTDYNIYASAGIGDKVIAVGPRVSVQNGTLTLVFTGTVNKASVATIVLAPVVLPTLDTPPPGYAAGSIPTDDASSFSVVLPSLVAENHPGADIGAYNPVGPSVSYERSYRSNLTTAGYSSPGMGLGWTDNYDITITSANATTWSTPLTLKYGNGAVETFTPINVVTGTETTVPFNHPAGAPYIVSGDPLAGAPGQWESLTLTFKDHSQMTFTPADPAGTNVKYVYTKLTNLVGRYITINRDTIANNNRVTTVQNDLAATLLTFSYDPNYGRMTSVVESNSIGDRKVSYAYYANSLLSNVSQIALATATGVADQWRYAPQFVNGKNYLASVDYPNPANPANYARNKLFYDQNGFVALSTDASGRQTSYQPSPNTNLTLLNDYNATGTLAMSHKQNYIPTTTGGGKNVNAGFQDGKGFVETMSYADTLNPWMPTLDISRKNEHTDITYDDASGVSYGSPATVTDARGTVTTNVYDRSVFALGQLMSSETHNGTTSLGTTSYTYYGPADGVINGLVHTITAPAPGSVGGAGATVTTTFSYDTLGNVTQVTAPGPNGLTTTTYDYVNGYGGVTQTEALGKPMTVTVSGPGATTTSTYFEYDGRGNLIAQTDALGIRTDYSYTIADAPYVTVLPPTTGTTRAYTRTDYQYPGGPVSRTGLYPEAAPASIPVIGATPFRYTDTTYTVDGEVATVTGSVEPVTYTYDGLSRVSTLKDGKNNITSYVYDAAGNLSQIKYPNAGSVFDTLTFAYDSDQNLTSRTDGRGFVTTYNRSSVDSRVDSVTYSSDATLNVAYSYDVLSRMTGLSNTAATHAYTLDNLGLPLTHTTSFTGGPQNQTLTYAYNPDGSRQSLLLPDATQVNNPRTVNSGQFTYGYDGIGRLTGVAPPWIVGTTVSGFPYPNEQFSYGYQANGRMTTSGDTQYLTTRTFNPRGFLTGVSTDVIGRFHGAAPTVATYAMNGANSYDVAGNRLSEVAVLQPLQYTNSGGVGNDFSHMRSFTYDNRDHLTGESLVPSGSGENIPGNNFTQYFDYDAVGNTTNFRGASPGLSANTFNIDNQIGNTGFGFDGNGNATTHFSTAYTFDGENRLTGIASPGFSATYG
ncbi:MAG: malectin domain-containing carbohydrate-binding protein, partial [Capsulimonas sp.]|uniref:malectin domain-containing carbohydrate-binding protein n=1 Tax=Capsulimonas sp. TaxID=2494211 RepID=UPI003266C5D8